MRCSQCGRPALYQVGEGKALHPLCLQCWSIVEDINFKKSLMSAAMMNQALDDMDAMVPIGPTSGRIPVAEIARAASQARTYNNIHVTNSNVGVINTGHLAKIDAAIEISKGTDSEEFGARLKDLMETILNDASIEEQAKKEMTEVVQAISNEVIGSKTPSKIVVGALFSKLKDLAAGVVVIGSAVEQLHAAWQHLSSMF